MPVAFNLLARMVHMDAFVYGTLRNPTRAGDVLENAVFDGDATLIGFHRVDGRYPTLAPGGRVEGRVLKLSNGDLDALDSYEGVDRGLYVRVRVPSDDEPLWTYVGDSDALGVDVEWPGDGTLAVRVERYIERNDVHVRR